MQGSVIVSTSLTGKISEVHFSFYLFLFHFVGFLSKVKFGKTAVILGLVKHALSKVVERKFHTF